MQHTLYILSLLRILVPVLSSIHGQISRPSSACGVLSIGSKAKIEQNECRVIFFIKEIKGIKIGFKTLFGQYQE